MEVTRCQRLEIHALLDIGCSGGDCSECSASLSDHQLFRDHSFWYLIACRIAAAAELAVVHGLCGGLQAPIPGQSNCLAACPRLPMQGMTQRIMVPGIAHRRAARSRPW
eukprot:2138139-Rhodomonas_salina.2